LTTLAERPWANYTQGHPITPRHVAQLLDGFRIQPRQIRQGAGTRKGYRRSDFTDVFRRYLPLETPRRWNGVAALPRRPEPQRPLGA